MSGDRRAWLERQIVETEELLASAKGAGAWTAVSTLTRSILKLRDALDKAADAGAARDLHAGCASGGCLRAAYLEAPEEELVERLRASAAAMPDAYLEVYVRAYLDRFDAWDAFDALRALFVEGRPRVCPTCLQALPTNRPAARPEAPPPMPAIPPGVVLPFPVPEEEP